MIVNHDKGFIFAHVPKAAGLKAASVSLPEPGAMGILRLPQEREETQQRVRQRYESDFAAFGYDLHCLDAG